MEPFVGYEATKSIVGSDDPGFPLIKFLQTSDLSPTQGWTNSLSLQEYEINTAGINFFAFRLVIEEAASGRGDGHGLIRVGDGDAVIGLDLNIVAAAVAEQREQREQNIDTAVHSV